MTLEIEAVKHSCGSHRPVPGSAALFLGIFPARRTGPASLGGTGSCWRGILIPCPVQGSVSAGMNIPMRLVYQKLLDLGKTWEKKKQRVKAEGAPHRKKKPTKGGSSYGEALPKTSLSVATRPRGQSWMSPALAGVSFTLHRASSGFWARSCTGSVPATGPSALGGCLGTAGGSVPLHPRGPRCLQLS